MGSKEELELHLAQNSLAPRCTSGLRGQKRITEVLGGNGCKRHQGSKMTEDLAADQCTGQVKAAFYREEYTVWAHIDHKKEEYSFMWRLKKA